MNSDVPPTKSSRYDEKSLISYSLSKRASFLATYCHHQQWTLPDSIVYYITKKPSLPKAYEKMIQSCKYFFIQNPILIVHRLSLICHLNVWHTSFNEKRRDLSNGLSEIWITDVLYISNNFYSEVQFVLSSILKKIYQSNIKEFTLWNQCISFKEFVFLAFKCKEITLRDAVIKDENGDNVILESIVKSVPNVKTFRYNIGEIAQNIITPETATELLKISHFSNINQLILTEIPETFDIETFYRYLKTNKKTKFYFYFFNLLSLEYKARLQEIIDEILSSKNREYKVPFINFHGIISSTCQDLWKLYSQS